MKTGEKFFRVSLIMLGVMLLTGLASVSAQDEPLVLPVQVLTLQFNAAPTEPPVIEEAEGTVVFKVNPVGTVTGDLEGAFAQRITQVNPVTDDPINPINLYLSITTFFTIETNEGMIEGYYAGIFYSPEDIYPDVKSRQYGQVLSVTAAYADLYLADVYYDGIVDFEEIDGAHVGLSDSGTLIIGSR